MPIMPTKPVHNLFSFLMITYNQEKYIEEAINSALAQDIDDLELVICDDCSTDRTFEIAQRVVSEYKGPFRIVLHRNTSNLGISGNFYKAFTLSSGDWLFMAAGDDVSLPNRCRVIADALSSYPDVLAFNTNYQVIDGEGQCHGFFSPDYPMAPGAILCWHRSLFTKFPPLGKHSSPEDMPLLTRVFFLGGTLVKLPECTMQYRIDGHSFTGEGRNSPIGVKQYQIKVTEALREGVLQRLEDLDYICSQESFIPCETKMRRYLNEMVASMEQDIASYQLSLRTMTGGLWEKLCYLFTANDWTHHRSFPLRFRLFLSSFSFLRFVKHCFIPCRTQLESMQAQLVQKLPENLQPVVVTTDFFFEHPICDFYQKEEGSAKT